MDFDIHEISNDDQADSLLEEAEKRVERADGRATTLGGRLEIATKKRYVMKYILYCIVLYDIIEYYYLMI